MGWRGSFGGEEGSPDFIAVQAMATREARRFMQALRQSPGNRHCLYAGQDIFVVMS
jgi:hypothetical protein